MPEKTVVVLGTATPGGGFPAYGWPYAEALNEMDPTLAVEPRNTTGSTENVPLLEQGKLDIGLATGEVTYEAIAGIGRAKATTLRIINATYSQAGMFMVRADSPYRLARALHLGYAKLAERLEQARESTLANTLAAAPQRDLIHTGVLRYMREIGLVR